MAFPVSLPFCDISLSNAWPQIIINNNDSIVTEPLVNGVLNGTFSCVRLCAKQFM